MRCRTPRLALICVAILGAALACSTPDASPDAVAPPAGSVPAPDESGTSEDSAESAGSDAGEDSAKGDGGAESAESEAGEDSAESAGKGAVGGVQAAKKVPACTDADVTTEITQRNDLLAGDTRRALVAVTNTSSSTCRVEGHVMIRLADAAGEVVDGPATTVDQPGQARPILLRAGSAAYQGIKWTVCDKHAETCAAGDTLRFTLRTAKDGRAAEGSRVAEGSRAVKDGRAAKLYGFPPPGSSDLTMSSLLLGTLQPSIVVAW